MINYVFILFVLYDKLFCLKDAVSNTWMFGNMKYLVLNRTFHSFTLLTREISWVNTQNEFHISAHLCTILYIYFIIFSNFPSLLLSKGIKIFQGGDHGGFMNL